MSESDRTSSNNGETPESSPATIGLHESARENFDERAEDLLRRFETVRHANNENSESKFPEIHASATISEEDIVGVVVRRVVEGITQKLVAVDLLIGEEIYRLNETAAFQNLCADVAGRRELRKHVSIATVEKRLIAWFGETIERGQQNRFTDSLLNWLQEHLERTEVWVPIANLRLESELPFGELVFRPVSSELIDTWVQSLPEEMSDEKRLRWEQRIRQRAQGYAAAVCQLESDPDSAFPVATMLAGEAVALLRLVGPEAMFPEARSCVHLRGRENLESHEGFIVGPEGPSRVLADVLKPFPEPLELTDSAIQSFSRHIDSLSSLLAKNPRSEFHERLLLALKLYSKSTLTSNIGEKLSMITTALECILLKDENEAIQQNIGERMAFFVSDDVDKRLEFVSLVRECYAMRSRYVHHGERPKDVDRLRIFMRHTFTFFLQVLWAQDECSTPREFLHQLDRMKLSGS